MVKAMKQCIFNKESDTAFVGFMAEDMKAESRRRWYS